MGTGRVPGNATASVATDLPTDRELEQLATRIRLRTLDMTSRAGAAHIGSVFSIAETLAVLYGGVLHVDPADPQWPGRDRFVLSKGHACAGLYAVLAERGFFPAARLEEFYVDGGTLAGHATHTGVPGVEVSTGALGHGLALAVGLALGAKRKGEAWRVFALLSDGECDEGSTWEAALLAPRLGLDNLTVVVDFNKIQSLGRVEDVLPLEPLAAKWESFRWDVEEVDGHDVAALRRALLQSPAEGRPRAVISHTVKGKGVSFMEDRLLWHYRTARGEEYERAKEELLAQLGPDEAS